MLLGSCATWDESVNLFEPFPFCHVLTEGIGLKVTELPLGSHSPWLCLILILARTVLASWEGLCCVFLAPSDYVLNTMLFFTYFISGMFIATQ